MSEDTTPTALQANESPAKAASWFDDVETLNLEEAAPQPVNVTLEEYVTVPGGQDENEAQLEPRRMLHHTTHRIETYVPVKAYNSMLLTRDKLMKERAGDAAAFEWMIDQVLGIWQLTEPEMTRERLMEGLSSPKIKKLFGIFFGNISVSPKP